MSYFYLSVLKLAPDAEFLTFMVSKAVRGDILQLDTGKELKLIGVKSPDLATPNSSAQYFSKEALRYTTELLKDKEVKVTFERRKTNSSGQWLGYVWMSDGELFNAKIVREGYGVPDEPSRIPNEAIREAVLAAFRTARSKKAGMWRDAEKAGDFVQEDLKSIAPEESFQSEEFQSQPAPVGAGPLRNRPLNLEHPDSVERRPPQPQTRTAVPPQASVWNRPIFNPVPLQSGLNPGDGVFAPQVQISPQNVEPSKGSRYYDRRSRSIGTYRLNHSPDGNIRGLTPSGPITGNYLYFENQRVPVNRGK